MPVYYNSVPSNYEVLLATQQLVTLLNSAPGWLRLFKNIFTPAYGSLPSDFVEANFTGYTPVSLSGAFSAPAKQVDGYYTSSTPTLSFTNSGASPSTVYGWWVSAGANWFFGGAFQSPVTIESGGTFAFGLTWQGLALGLFLP
jgi:hypothetical protein